MNFKTIVISGPTASGKSAIAIKLAKKLNAEIINIDSVQIFKEFNIGSGKVTKEEQQVIPHHFIDYLEPNQKITAFEYRKLVIEKLTELKNKGKTVILVAGTTLYFKTIFSNLKILPKSDSQIRAKLEALDNNLLYKELLEVDLESAKIIKPNDRVRIIRALEIYRQTGINLTEHKKVDGNLPNLKALILLLCNSRAGLYEKINQRVENMLALGLVNETKNLISQYGDNLQAINSLGYFEAKQHLTGILSESDLASTIAQNTRHFAKRQMTFWRNEPIKNNWQVFPDSSEADLFLGAESSIKSAKLKSFPVKQFNTDSLVASILVRQNWESTEIWNIFIKELQ